LGLALPVPHQPLLSRRVATLEVLLPRKRKGEALHAVFDSTGLKVFGEGEWKVRVHGYQKRRTWRKLHLGIDAETGEIIAQVATSSNVSDKEVLPDLLEQIAEPIKQVTADGGYDYATCYEAIAARKARAVIPPRRTGRLHPLDERFRARDKNLGSIRKDRTKEVEA
jgi:IS5 family transposase